MPRTELNVQVESFDAVWPEADQLGLEHFCEVDGGVEPRRHYRLDEEQMRAMNERGILRILTARWGMKRALVGYLTWQLSLDVESKNLMIAQQGAWFVRPGHPRAAKRLFDYSIVYLRGLGVQCIYPHHRMQGRGRGLERFFLRQGAKATQVTYSLWIGV
jgi:hypothetical protein